ncbi:hypothetical protein SCHAM137S_02413 [Streptomyces chartreusis]|nr:hypothetical protein SAMN05216482_8893 [Streptomyces sp. PAN_FS17]
MEVCRPAVQVPCHRRLSHRPVRVIEYFADQARLSGIGDLFQGAQVGAETAVLGRFRLGCVVVVNAVCSCRSTG